MIQEAYCSFELSKLLKEKGFSEMVNGWYIPYEDGDVKFFVNAEASDGNNYKHAPWVVSAPTHQMAMAWLREKNIGITPEVHTTQDPKDYYWSAIIYYLDKSWDILQYVSEPSKNVKDGYDGVIEQALKYALEKLI